MRSPPSPAATYATPLCAATPTAHAPVWAAPIARGCAGSLMSYMSRPPMVFATYATSPSIARPALRPPIRLAIDGSHTLPANAFDTRRRATERHENTRRA